MKVSNIHTDKLTTVTELKKGQKFCFKTGQDAYQATEDFGATEEGKIGVLHFDNDKVWTAKFNSSKEVWLLPANTPIAKGDAEVRERSRATVAKWLKNRKAEIREAMKQAATEDYVASAEQE